MSNTPELERPDEPRGWIDPQRSEWGELPQYLAALEKYMDSLKNDDLGETLVIVDTLGAYGSTKRRPLTDASTFTRRHLLSEAMIQRYKNSGENLKERDAASIFENFACRQLDENLEAVYKLIFGTEKTELQGWSSAKEKTDFLQILEELKSDLERKKFWDFQKAHMRPDKWKNPETFSFAHFWEKRVTIINSWIEKFSAHTAPEHYRPLGHKDLENFLELLGIGTSLDDIIQETRKWVALVSATDEKTEKKEMDEQEFQTIVENTIHIFIEWCKELELPSDVLATLEAWEKKNYKDKIGILDRKIVSSAVVGWNKDQISVKDLDYWNGFANPQKVLKTFIWHEMTHLLQIYAYKVKPAVNSHFLMELQSILSELVLTKIDGDISPILSKIMKRRALNFTVGYDMHASNASPDADWEKELTDAFYPPEITETVKKSLQAGPFRLQQYWLAMIFLAAKFKNDSSLKELNHFYKNMFAEEGRVNMALEKGLTFTAAAVESVVR